YVSMTNHMRSGFNLLAHLRTWKRLPADVAAIIQRQADKFVRLQRQDQEQMNRQARATLARRGLVFNEVNADTFRMQLFSVYTSWKRRLGTRCANLLEESANLQG